MHSVTDRRTDRQTDGRQDDANSRPYCVAVRSAKNVSTGAIIRAKPGTDRAGRLNYWRTIKLVVTSSGP